LLYFDEIEKKEEVKEKTEKQVVDQKKEKTEKQVVDQKKEKNPKKKKT